MTTLNEMMAKLEDAPMTAGGIYLLPGEYGLKIREVKNGEAASQGWSFFLAEVEVVESTVDERPPGTVCEWMVAFKNPQYEGTYLGNVKNFLWAAFNGFDPSVTPEQINGKVWALAVSTQQPLRDKFVRANAFEKEKKNTPGENFTRITFQPWAGPEVQAAA